MSGLSDYSQNKLIDVTLRGQAFTAPATLYHALLTCTRGARANSTAYAANDTIAIVASDTKMHLYKCTTAGTSTTAQGTLYPGVLGEAITDGTAVLTEQGAANDAGTVVECLAGAYARAAVTASLANYAGTQAPASTAASSGILGVTSNNAVVTFPTPTAQWVPTGGAIWAVAIYDAATAGNLLYWAPVSALKTSISNGDPAPTIAVAALSIQIGT